MAITPTSAAVCQGGGAALTATPTGGTPPYTFAWSPSTGLSSTTGSTVTASPLATTSYTVTVTDSRGATASSTRVVTVNPLPSATIAGAPTGAIVLGSVVNLTGAASGGTAPVTFSWTRNGIAFGTASSVTDLPPLGTTTYRLTVTDANGCVSASSLAAVNVFDYTMSVAPPSQTVIVGSTGSATYTVSTSLVSGSSTIGLPSTVPLTISGLPATVTAVLPASVALGGSTPLILQTTPATPVGDYLFTVTGSLPGGVRTATGHLQVTFNICFLYDQTQVHQLGSTIPIKLQLCDVNGANLSSSGIVVHATSLQLVSQSVTGVPVLDSGSANPDNDFRFDPTIGTTGGYIFNLSTKNLSAGSWALVFQAGADPTFHQAQFQIK